MSVFPETLPSNHNVRTGQDLYGIQKMHFVSHTFDAMEWLPLVDAMQT